jgi:multicomponent Na+:H+ antiporter subunit G
MGFYNLLVIFLLVGGLFFFFAGAVGILRFPDFYSRLHPAGKLDTMGLFTSMMAMALWVVHEWTLGAVLTALKILLIVAFVFITSPTATHAIVDAGVRAGLLPWTKDDSEDKT